jgi:hypothetical protein
MGRVLCSYGGEYQGDDGGSPVDGGGKHLWNVHKLLPDYTAQQPRRQSSSQYGFSAFIIVLIAAQILGE